MQNTIQKFIRAKKLAAKSKKQKASSGFTLLEVVFVIAIFAIMASIVLFRFNDFGSRTEFDNLAQDIALHIVEAQKSAISGLTSSSLLGGTEELAPSYGVYFSNIADASLNRQFTYFSDNDHSKYYDATPDCGAIGDECISVTSITSGDSIDKLCYKTSSGLFDCIPAPGGTAHVTFTRPWPTATMNLCSDVLLTSCTPDLASVQTLYVELISGVDPSLQKTIVVTALGEVHVADGCAAVANDPGASCTPIIL